MKKMTNIVYVLGILMFLLGGISAIIVVTQVILGLDVDIILLVLIIYIIPGLMIIKMMYQLFLTVNRNTKLLGHDFSIKEMFLLYDAITLIESAKKNYKFGKFGVYKVKYIDKAWFYRDDENDELSIFIPFDKYMDGNEEWLFMMILHEIMHSQSEKNSSSIFIKDFNEGLNQLMTEWLIDNYSSYYTNAKVKHIKIMRLPNKRVLTFNAHLNVYNKQVAMVKAIIENANLDMKEVFYNYIDFNSEFFEKFVPKEYYIDYYWKF